MRPVRAFVRRATRRAAVGVPAILSVMRRSPFSALRHAPFLLFLLGVPFFAFALADPLTALHARAGDVSGAPDRARGRWVEQHDACSFRPLKLKANESRAFYTAVASAERFMRLRMNGPYRDLIALIQFGNNAYVVTPFTTDYENVLLSIRLISDPVNWGAVRRRQARRSSRGSTEGTKLFKAFDFPMPPAISW